MGTAPSSPKEEGAPHRIMAAKMQIKVRGLEEQVAVLRQREAQAINQRNVALDRMQKVEEGSALMHQQVERLKRAVEMGDRRCQDLLAQLDESQGLLLEAKRAATTLSEAGCKQEHAIQALEVRVQRLDQKMQLANICIAEKDRLLNDANRKDDGSGTTPR